MKLSLFQGVLIGVFGLAAVVGLFVFATYSGQNASGDTVGPVTIWGTLEENAMKEVLQAATLVEPRLKGVTYVKKNAGTFGADLAAALATDSGPDMVLVSQEHLLSISKFLMPIPLANLTPRNYQSAFTDGADLFAAPGGQGYYGMPFLIDPLVLYYNRSTLSSNGIAQLPATWEELTGLVPRMTETTSTRRITRSLIALGAYGNVQNARGILSTLFMQTGVPITGYTATGVLTSDLGTGERGGVPPGAAVLRFYTQFADPTKVSYTWNETLPNSQTAFSTGDLALYIGYASEASYLRAANPNLNFDVSPIPQPATATIKSVYGQIYAFMIPRGSLNPGGASEAAAILVGEAGQTAGAALTGLAPAARAELAKRPGDPVAAIAYEEALYTRAWLSPKPQDADAVFSSMINNVITGRTTLDTALSIAERSLDELLQ